jgi:PIN domain nuclease of toxin-antitoxin system
MRMMNSSGLPIKYILDTHALVWFQEGNPRLGAGARTVMSDPRSQLILPAIALAEAAWIVQQGKTSIPSPEDLWRAIDADPRVAVYPLDERVIRRSFGLVAIREMHDRYIVATTLLLIEAGEQAALLTRDQNIAGSALVPIIW